MNRPSLLIVRRTTNSLCRPRPVAPLAIAAAAAFAAMLTACVPFMMPPPPPPPGCMSNAECDDGLFCNGAETCDPVTGMCVAGTSPCAAGQLCDEATDQCSDPPGMTFNLTLGQDTFTGAELADMFIANLEFNPPTASSIPTLQNGDVLNGGPNSDSLTATFNFPATTAVAPTITSVETITITDVGAGPTTLTATAITGLVNLNFTGGTNTTTFNVAGLTALVNLGVSNQAAATLLTFAAAATAGGADAITIALSSVTGGNLDLNCTGSGIETVNLVSNGAANALNQWVTTGAITTTRLNISGSAPLNINRVISIPTTITTIDTTAATGPVDLTAAGGQNITFNGGAGDDLVNLVGTYTTADMINGGGGRNTLGMNATQAAVAVPQANVSNISRLLIVNTLLGEPITLSHFGATDLLLDSTGPALLLNLPSNVLFPSGNRTVTFNNDDLNDQFNMTVAGAGTNDVFTIEARNADQSFGATFLHVIGAETVNYISENGLDGTAADGGANQFLGLQVTPTVGTGVLNFLGSVQVNVVQNVKAGVVNASALGARLVMETSTAVVLGGSTTVTGTPFNDELVGSTSADLIVAGEGHDQVKAFDGADVVTLGPGTDLCHFDAFSHFGDFITDFVVGEDQIGLGSGNLNFGGIAGTENAPQTLTAANFETNRIAIVNVAGGDALKIVRLSAAQTDAQLTADVGAAVAAYVLMFNSTQQVGMLVHDADWSTAGGRAVVCRFENINTIEGVAAISFNSFAEID